MSSTKNNYFSALAAFSDSDSEDDVKKLVTQSKSVRKKKVAKKPVRAEMPEKPAPAKGDGKAVGLKFQPRVKEPSKSWAGKTRHRFAPASRKEVWSQIINSAVSASSKRLTQGERKRLARKQQDETAIAARKIVA